MRELLLELGFSKQISDHDQYLLEVSNRAALKVYSDDRNELFAPGSSAHAALELVKQDPSLKLGGSAEIYQKIQAGEM